MTSTFTGGPGFLAFVVTFGLVVAGILLFRSLSKHLRKVRTQPSPDEGTTSLVAQDDKGARDEVADESSDS